MADLSPMIEDLTRDASAYVQEPEQFPHPPKKIIGRLKKRVLKNGHTYVLTFSQKFIS